MVAFQEQLEAHVGTAHIQKFKPKRNSGETIAAYNQRLSEWFQIQIQKQKNKKKLEKLEKQVVSIFTEEVVRKHRPSRKDGEKHTDFFNRLCAWYVKQLNRHAKRQQPSRTKGN